MVRLQLAQRERERERETERQRERQTDRDRERQTDRDRQRETDRETERETVFGSLMLHQCHTNWYQNVTLNGELWCRSLKDLALTTKTGQLWWLCGL